MYCILQSSFSLEQIRALNGKMQPPVYKNHCDSIKSTSTENKQTDFMETVSKDDLQMNTKSNIIPYKNKALVSKITCTLKYLNIGLRFKSKFFSQYLLTVY